MGWSNTLKLKQGLPASGQILNAEIQIPLSPLEEPEHIARNEWEAMEQQAQAEGYFGPFFFPRDLDDWAERMKSKMRSGDFVWLTLSMEDGYCKLELDPADKNVDKERENTHVPKKEIFSIAFDFESLAKLKRAIDFMFTELMHEAAKNTEDEEPRHPYGPMTIAVVGPSDRPNPEFHEA